MPYHKINISKLSHNQILRLLRGHRIRVKHGSGHEIHASEEQHKKITRAHKKGSGATIQFDPYQIEQHQHMRHKQKGGKCGKALFPAGYSVKRKRKKGKGFADIAKKTAKVLAPIVIDESAKYLKKRVNGSAINRTRKRRRRKGKPIARGKGVGKKIIKGIKEYGPLAAEVGLAML